MKGSLLTLLCNKLKLFLCFNPSLAIKRFGTEGRQRRVKFVVNLNVVHGSFPVRSSCQVY